MRQDQGGGFVLGQSDQGHMQWMWVDEAGQSVVRKVTAEKSLPSSEGTSDQPREAPERQNRRREVPKSQSVVRKRIAEQSLPSSVRTSDQPPTRGSAASMPISLKPAASMG